jgi:hypothetical protein
MQNEDTKKLLSECDAGIKMAVGSIGEVLPSVESAQLWETLDRCRRAHEQLGGQTQQLLDRCSADGKSPNPVAKGMSWLKTNVKLAMQPGDQSVADLIIDGCNMGVKSLHRYCNRYPAAAPEARRIAGQLIEAESRLTRDLESYL